MFAALLSRNFVVAAFMSLPDNSNTYVTLSLAFIDGFFIMGLDSFIGFGILNNFGLHWTF